MSIPSCLVQSFRTGSPVTFEETIESSKGSAGTDGFLVRCPLLLTANFFLNEVPFKAPNRYLSQKSF